MNTTPVNNLKMRQYIGSIVKSSGQTSVQKD